MNIREDILKFIPRPENKDVVLYNIQLNDLIDVNVEVEYQEIYSEFISKKELYLKLKDEIQLYQETINQTYLYSPSWSEEDYLKSLQDNKKTFSLLYSNIKKAESNIEILKKKIKNINEKIEIQIAKENKERESKKILLEKEISINKEKLENYRVYINSYKETLKFIDNQLEQNNEDFLIMQQLENDLNNGTCQCIYCGGKINPKNKNTLIHNRILKNLEINKKNAEKLFEQKNKLELNLSFYENEISKIKSNLNNNINFKKEDKNLYIKKSIEVLKLEALRDEMINNIQEFEKTIRHDSNYNSPKFIKIKDELSKYELSLNNLRKIKEMKSEINKKMDDYKQLEIDLKEIIKKINHYLEFLSIFYKIYEQKASEYCGPKYKFKFFKIEDYKIIDVFTIFYEDVEYSQLSSSQQKQVDKLIIEKFSIFS